MWKLHVCMALTLVFSMDANGDAAPLPENSEQIEQAAGAPEAAQPFVEPDAGINSLSPESIPLLEQNQEFFNQDKVIQVVEPVTNPAVELDAQPEPAPEHAAAPLAQTPVLKLSGDEAASLFKESDVRNAYKKWLVAHFDRQVQILEERKSTIRITNWIGYGVSVIAHVLLLLAVLAAFGEYRQARRRRTQPVQSQELQVSLDGISLKTSLHGTVLLVLAMMFYVAYLRLVYPITVLG